MSFTWLTVAGSDRSSTAIILGEVPLESLRLESQLHPRGLLWLCDCDNHDAELIDESKIRRLSIQSDPIVLEERISDFVSLNYESLPIVKISPVSENSSKYKTLISIVVHLLDSIARARRTRKETGFVRQSQIMLNLPQYLKRRVPQDWNGLAKSSWVLVVGAGPSLDVTLPLLTRNFVRPIIVACDSALRSLDDQGLEPDFVISLDPNKTFSSCCRHGYAPGTLILSSQSHPSWSRQWGERIRFLSGRILTEDWLAEKGVAKTSLLATNNVGLTALAFADFLAPRLILTIGMDQSGGEGGHERYAHSTQRASFKISARHFHEVPGNFHQTVKTPFWSDWVETSDLTRRISTKTNVFNFTDRGAVLDGATVVHPKEVDSLRSVLRQRFSDFSPEPEVLTRVKSLEGPGLDQLMGTLASRCDLFWKSWVDHDGAPQIGLKEILQNQDMAQLVGDFSFVAMPLLQQSSFEGDQIQDALDVLKTIIFQLEDAILECRPSSGFGKGFLNQS